MLRRSHAPILTIVLTLALGIGANTAIFTVVNSVLLRPLPFRDPSRLAAIWDSYQGLPKLGVSPLEDQEWSRQTDIFDSIARYRYVGTGREMNLTGGLRAVARPDHLVEPQPFPAVGNPACIRARIHHRR